MIFDWVDEPSTVFTGDSDLLCALRHFCGIVRRCTERDAGFEDGKSSCKDSCVDVSEALIRFRTFREVLAWHSGTTIFGRRTTQTHLTGLVC